MGVAWNPLVVSHGRGGKVEIEIKRRILLVNEVCYLVTAAEFIACLVRYPSLMI